MQRYCFEQHSMIQRMAVHNYDDDTDDVMSRWAIYDRRAGFIEPIAYVRDAGIAQMIVDALNEAV